MATAVGLSVRERGKGLCDLQHAWGRLETPESTYFVVDESFEKGWKMQEMSLSTQKVEWWM